MGAASTKIFDRRPLRAGDILIREGEPGDAAFLIQSGRFDILKRDRGVDVLLTTVGRNEIVGEMSLIDNACRSATVRCLEPGTVVVIDRSNFEQRLKQLDKFTRVLLEVLAQKLRALNEGFLCSTRQTRGEDHAPALTELQRAWARAGAEERRQFLRYLGSEEHKRGAAAEGGGAGDRARMTWNLKE